MSDPISSERRNAGGVQAATRYLIDELVRIPKLDLHLIAFTREETLARTYEVDGYSLHLLPSRGYGTLTLFRADQKSLNVCLARLRPDIVHSQGAGKFGILTVRSGFPHVITIHGILPEEVRYFSGLRKRNRYRILSWQSEFFCIRRAENIIVISPYVADYYNGSIRGRCFFVPNPTDMRYFSITRRETEARILFVGHLVPLKGIVDLVRAVAAITPEFRPRVVLAGPETDTRYVREIHDEVVRLDLSNQVQFLGLVSSTELMEQLSYSSCLVLPSFQENAPMVIQEAMAAGVPVIATDVGGIPYQITDGESGLLVPPGNVEALANSLRRVLADRSLRLRLGQSARRSASTLYPANVVAKKTLEVYEQIIR